MEKKLELTLFSVLNEPLAASFNDGKPGAELDGTVSPKTPPLNGRAGVVEVEERDEEVEVRVPRVGGGVYQVGAGVFTLANFSTHVLSMPNATA